MDAKRQQLRDFVEKYCLVQGSSITLASGRSSNFYVDCRIALMDPRSLPLIAELVYDQIVSVDNPPIAVGGTVVGAVPITAAVVLHTAHRELQAVACSGWIAMWCCPPPLTLRERDSYQNRLRSSPACVEISSVPGTSMSPTTARCCLWPEPIPRSATSPGSLRAVASIHSRSHPPPMAASTSHLTVARC